MQILSIIIFQIGNTLFMFGVMRAMGIFYEKRDRSFVLTLVSCFCALVITNLNTFFVTNILLIVPLNVLAIFVISLQYKSSLMKRLTAISCTYCLVLVLRIVHFPTVIYVFSEAFTTDMFHFLDFLIAGPLLFLAASLFRKKSQNIRRQVAISPIVLSTSLVLIVAMFAIEFSTPIFDIPLLAGWAIQIIFFVACFFPLFSQDILISAYENKLKGAESDYYLTQCTLMQESVESARSIRHDMKNHLAMLKDYSVKNEASEITKYINRLLGEIEEGKLYSDTGNIVFDSIINYKLRNAQNDHIVCDVDMFIPIALQVDAVDVVTIVGNLLDNALNAVAKVEEKAIRLNIRFDKGGLFIQVENTFNGETYEDNRGGYGLKNIKQAVEKYDGSMNVSCTDTVFTVSMVLLVDV